MEILNIIWFILILVLFTGFFILEGFDYGVGMLILGKSSSERSTIIKTIAPFWHANQVWMITAGGALFAAFPGVYSTMFSAFYVALFLLLFALIFRGVAFELRHHIPQIDCAIVFGSFLPAILWGVAFANLLKGIPINSQFISTGNFFDLLSPYTILAGLTFLLLFVFHGAAFLLLRLGDEGLLLHIKKSILCFGAPAFILYVTFFISTFFATDAPRNFSWYSPFFIGTICLFNSIVAIKRERTVAGFIFSSLSIAGLILGMFVALFPRLMVSSLNPDWSLTIYNAASTSHTLAIMTGAAVVLVPIVLIYQAWSYRLFKERIQ